MKLINAYIIFWMKRWAFVITLLWCNGAKSALLNMIILKWNKYKPSSVPVFWLVPGHLSIQVHTRVSQLATQHLTRTGSRNFHSEPAALIISTTGWKELRRKCEEKNIVPYKSVYDSWRGTFVFTRGFMRTSQFFAAGVRLGLRDMLPQWSSIFTTFSFWWRPLWQARIIRRREKLAL